MLISNDHKFIFLANPRTACTSMRSILQPFSFKLKLDPNELPSTAPNASAYRDYSVLPSKIGNLKHLLQDEARVILNHKNDNTDFSEYFEFVFVRNPYTRLSSFYNQFRLAKLKNYSWNFKDYLNKIEVDITNRSSQVPATKYFIQANYIRNPLSANVLKPSCWCPVCAATWHGQSRRTGHSGT